MANGTAPVPVSSGRTDRHRLNRGGNRQRSRIIHFVALTQASRDPAGRAYYQRKQAEGKTRREALRRLKTADLTASTAPRPPPRLDIEARMGRRPPLHLHRRGPPLPADHHRPTRRQGGRPRTSLRDRIAVAEDARGDALLHLLTDAAQVDAMVVVRRVSWVGRVDGRWRGDRPNAARRRGCPCVDTCRAPLR